MMVRGYLCRSGTNQRARTEVQVFLDEWVVKQSGPGAPASVDGVDTANDRGV